MKSSTLRVIERRTATRCCQEREFFRETMSEKEMSEWVKMKLRCLMLEFCHHYHYHCYCELLLVWFFHDHHRHCVDDERWWALLSSWCDLELAFL